ncbi:hypothetical protein Kurepalu2_00002 [Pseudomonas phage vB_PpuP-Kurepalu-2]
MANRKIGQIINGETGRSSHLYFNSEFDEYTVCFYKGDTYQVDADYHTDDRTDAFDTAEHWSKQRD